MVVALAVGDAPPAHLAHIPTAKLAALWEEVLALCAHTRAVLAELRTRADVSAAEAEAMAERLEALARKTERAEVKLRRLVAAGGAL
jgi:hypothetical protein